MQDLLFIVFFLVLIIVTLSIVISSLRNGISPMPTSNKTKAKILANLPKAVDGTILELGSGWGTLAIPLALKYPENLVIGYETSLIPYLVSTLIAKSYGFKNLKILNMNFNFVNFGGAGLIVCYLYPEAMSQLKIKFINELQPGSLVVSNTFGISGIKPIETIEVDDIYKTKIYFYKFIR